MKKIYKITGFLICFILWDLLALKMNQAPVPRVSRIIESLIQLFRDEIFYQSVFSSLQVVTLGILVAVVFGFVLGVAIYQFKIISFITLPVVEAIRGISALTLFPLLISTIGIGLESRIFVICWTAWPAVLIQTIFSLGNIDESIIDVARDLGANDIQILFRIRLPLSLRGIVSGIKIAISGGWIGLVASEMLGATKGLGYYLLWSAQSFEYTKVYALILVVAFLGWAMNAIMALIERNMEVY